MAKQVGEMTEAELARFIQGAVRTQIAQLPVSLTLRSVSVTELVQALKDLSVTGRVFITNLPTADPHVKGQLWSNVGVVTVSAG